MLLGLLKPGRGNISVLGHNPWKHDPAYYKKLGIILDHDGFAGTMTIAENLGIFAEAKGMERTAGPRLCRGTMEKHVPV